MLQVCLSVLMLSVVACMIGSKTCMHKTDFHKPGVYESGRACANPWSFFGRKLTAAAVLLHALRRLFHVAGIRYFC